MCGESVPRVTVVSLPARGRPLTWRLSRACTVLNGVKFHADGPGADLARKQSGFDQLAGEHVPGRRAGRARATTARRQFGFGTKLPRAFRALANKTAVAWGRHEG